MPLSFARQGEKRIIISLCGDEQLVKRLKEMGFTSGETVEVLDFTNAGMLLKIRGSKIAVNCGLTHCISVA